MKIANTLLELTNPVHNINQPGCHRLRWCSEPNDYTDDFSRNSDTHFNGEYGI